MRRAAALVLATALLGACSSSGRSRTTPPASTTGPAVTAPTTSAPPTTVATLPLDRISLRLVPVADVGGVSAFATRAGDPALYVAEQRGVVRRLVDGNVDDVPVLDLSRDVLSGGERGLLGLAFSPDGTHLYVHFTNRDGDTRLVELAMNANTADPATRRQLLAVEQPYPNHNGGQVAFGPDGLLYLGLGDGGAAGDPRDNAQNLGSLLGKILRIDPRPNGGAPYTVPADNPFVDHAGARPEVYVFGLRNPWRFSFDTDGALWIGDVGQNAWEEIDWLPAARIAGANMGWSAYEGRARYKTRSEPADAVPPVAVYPNPRDGCSVIGGGVYRGAAIPALTGAYLYTDYCAGSLRGLRIAGDGSVVEEVSWSDAVAEAPTTLGRDPGGEWYVGTERGEVLRVVSA